MLVITIKCLIKLIISNCQDLKPSNIGVSADLEIKVLYDDHDNLSSVSINTCLVQILDFGLGRKKKGEMTGYVTTRYWRAPEILLQWMHYGEKGRSTSRRRFVFNQQHHNQSFQPMFGQLGVYWLNC